MENIGIIIMSGILVILFVLFGIGTIAEFSRMSDEPYDSTENKGGVLALKKFFDKILG